MPVRSLNLTSWSNLFGDNALLIATLKPDVRIIKGIYQNGQSNFFLILYILDLSAEFLCLHLNKIT